MYPPSNICLPDTRKGLQIKRLVRCRQDARRGGVFYPCFTLAMGGCVSSTRLSR